MMLLRSVDKLCFSSLKDLLLCSPLVMVWVVTSWVVDVVEGFSLIRRVVFLSSRVAVSLGRLVFWCRTIVHRKLMRLKVGPCLGDHFFFVIELLCLVWWCPLYLNWCLGLFGFVFFVWVDVVVSRGPGLVWVPRGVVWDRVPCC